ncbi:MAG: SH3 domain-containing protein [Gallionella sp.]|nr:SH3 domain-containing protein [Gallionella sp.]
MRHILWLCAALVLLISTSAARATEYVSVKEASAVLYDAPSVKAKKLFVVNRYMPLEQVVVLDSWVKVRDKSGGLYWVEKKALSSTRYVFALLPIVDVLDQPVDGAKRVFQVRQQIALELLESTGAGWLKVKHLDGEVGYVRSSEVWGG